MTDLGYVLAASAARRLPPWLSDRVAVWIADAYTRSHGSQTRAVDRRLRRIWAETSREGAPPSARDTHRAFALAVRDFLASGAGIGGSPRVRLDAEARAILGDARSSGRSTVLVSGHFGPWEVALQWLAGEIGSVDALARPHPSRAVERFFASRRAAFGVRTLSAGRCASAALARLRAGGWIAALVDRGVRERPRAGRGVDLADGEPLVQLDAAPLLLARRTRAQVLAGVAWRAPDGAIEVRFHPTFTLEPWRGGIALAQAKARLQRFFDAHVRAHPTQWFDWSARPAAGPAGDGVDAARG